ncbi:MAG: ice-binding family protein [Chloroflexota bacterium]
MKRRRLLLLLIFSLVVVMGAAWPISAFAATQPRLGTSTSFAVLAAAGITNSGATNITGDVGTFPTTSETGFAGPAPNTVTLAPGSVNHAGDAVTQGARVDEVTAYNDLAGQTPCPALAGGTLDGRTLIPGCYNFSSSAILNVGQTLTLSGFGIYVFQIGSALTIGNGTIVSLINGAMACGVFWQVTSSATIGTAPANFQGTLIAGTSISVNTGAVWTGRALAGALAPSGAVTLLSNTIIRPGAGCAGLPFTGIPLSLRGGFPWQLALIGIAGAVGALVLGSSVRARRRSG